MKVAVLGLRGFPDVPGGVETHAQKLYPRLAVLGCDVVVFTRRPYVNPQMRSWCGVTLKALPCPKHKFLEAFLHSVIAVFAAYRERPDVLHIHAIGPSLALPAARLLGMRVVVTHHGPDYERKKWGYVAKQVLRAGETCARRWAHQIICVAPHIAERIRFTSRSEPIVIPNGVEIPSPASTTESLDRFGLTAGKYVFTLGRFVPEKGFHDLLEAFARLSTNDKRAAGWKFVIAGASDHQDAYSRELCAIASDTPHVVLTGYQTGRALQELFSHAGLFVLPSLYEGLPIALLEAMSYGLSCIASDIPANTAVGLPQERLFEPGDVQQLGERLSRFLASPLTAAERKAQIEYLRNAFDWDTIAHRTLAVYQAVARRGDFLPADSVPLPVNG